MTDVIEIVMGGVGEPGEVSSADLATLVAELADLTAELLEHQGAEHVVVPKFPWYTPMAVGQRYNGNGRVGHTTRTTGTALNNLIIGGPLFSGEIGVELDSFDVNVVTAAAAGGIYRAGVWIIDDQQAPFRWVSGVKYATLLAEVLSPALLEPFDVTTIGVKVITPEEPIVVPPETWFAVGGVSQVAVCQPTIGLSDAVFNPMGQSNVASGTLSVEGWPYQQNVDGPLPADFVPFANLNNIGHGVGFRRSA